MKMFNRQAHTGQESIDLPLRFVPELVAAQAVARPSAIAVTAGAQVLTYRELDRRANSMAYHLRSLGVGPEVVVGLYLPRSLDLVVGALGIWKAGGAYVPLDPAYPSDRLSFMLDDAHAPVLITNSHLARVLPKADRHVVLLDDTAKAGESRISQTEITPSELAYVIYTSGSTGRPKGVEVTHTSLANLVAWHTDAFSVTNADRASHVAGLGFDAAVWELWPYLAGGATVSLADEQTRNSAELLREWLIAQKITIGFVPTPLAEHLLDPGVVWPSTTDLRIVLTGGDTLHVYPRPGLPFVLVNNYGPTECTVVATSGVVPPTSSPEAAPPIGTPIANTEIYLLDEHLNQVAPGAAGEIHVGGAGLARGYRNRPDLTAEKFISNTFGAGRLYKTGDLGRQLPDGQIMYLGRTDDQVKIRGYRIEPGEISSVLNRHQDVRTSLVVAREDVPGDKRLVAYMVLHDGAVLSHSEVRDFLRSYLPEYMLPSVFVRLVAFPLTAHGKIDRAALPAPEAANMLQEEGSAADGTPIERRVAEILGELLNLEEIDIDDNFFLLGGHSLLGAQLMARLRDAFGVAIGLRSLFEAPTVAALSAEITRLLEHQESSGPQSPVGTRV